MIRCSLTPRPSYQSVNPHRNSLTPRPSHLPLRCCYLNPGLNYLRPARMIQLLPICRRSPLMFFQISP